MSGPPPTRQAASIDASRRPAPDATDAPDLAGSVLTDLSRFGLLGLLAQIALALGVVGAAVLAPERLSQVLGAAVGVALLVTAVVAAAIEIRKADRSIGAVATAGAGSIIGALMIVDADRWLTPIGRTCGVVMVLSGVQIAITELRAAGRLRLARRIRRTAALVCGGIVSFLFLEAIFGIVAVGVAILAVANGLISVGVRTGLTDIGVAPEKSRRPLLVRWIDGKGKTSQRRGDIYESVFFEGPQAPARIGRFMLMMLFASVISAAGVLSDSTAVVIGAMLVAPLINPMMGIGLSLATGWPNRLARSACVVLGGISVAVGTAWVLAIAARIAVDLDANSQIVSRSSPRLIDLVIAVAAGAAGAYALSRKDASSSLPGVAVAIALVPPLSVVGITAQAGDWEQAAGTLLLFLTNLVAIILAGGLVFVLTGVVPLQRFAENQHRVRTAFGAVVALTVLVIGGLVINGRQIAEDALAVDDARNVVVEWLGDESEFQVVSVTVDDRDIAVLLAGPGQPPQADQLVGDLEESLDGDVRLDLQWIPRRRMILTSAGG